MAKFAFWGFSEVRSKGILRSCARRCDLSYLTPLPNLGGELRDEEKGGHAGDLYTLEGTHVIDAALSRSQGIDKTQLTEKPRRTEASEMPDGNPIRIGQANTASNPGNETSLSRNENTAATVFVAQNLNAGGGIHGMATSAAGVRGESTRSSGVIGLSPSGPGVSGTSDVIGVSGASGRGPGVSGTTSGNCLWATPRRRHPHRPPREWRVWRRR
jgi:hypothetical protein